MEVEEIKNHVDSISLAKGAQANKLCELWPKAKEALLLLAALINNPVVKVIISSVIAAGDALVTKLCK